MKSFLTKYWKRILILIAIIFIIINVVNKCLAPHILVDEYAKYGPDIKYNEININTEHLISESQKNSPFDENTFRIIVLAIVLILVALLIGDIVSRKSSGAKKK